jgi:hypothetical protein
MPVQACASTHLGPVGLLEPPHQDRQHGLLVWLHALQQHGHLLIRLGEDGQLALIVLLQRRWGQALGVAGHRGGRQEGGARGGGVPGGGDGWGGRHPRRRRQACKAGDPSGVSRLGFIT